MVLACSGITRSDPSDSSFQDSDYSLILFFSFFFFSFFYFLLYIFNPSLLFFKQDSITFISTPSIFNASTNSSTSQPFFSPKAFLSPLVTVLLFFSTSSPLFFLGCGTSSSSESATLLPSLLSSDSDAEERLLLSSISSQSFMMMPYLLRLFFFYFTSPKYFLSNLLLRSVILQYTITIKEKMHFNTCSSQLDFPQQLCLNNLTSKQHDSHTEMSGLKLILVEAVANLKASVMAKETELREIKEKIKYYYDCRRKRKLLEEKEKKVESQFEDLQLFQQKLKKEIRILVQEEQIIKGKAIIEHNRIREIKVQQQREEERRGVLQKHLQEMQKGAEIQKKNVKAIKQQLKKKNLHKNHIQQTKIKSELRQLQNALKKKTDTLQKVKAKKKTRVTRQTYDQVEQKYHQLEQQCQNTEQIQKENKKLKSQRQALKERINFLQNVGTSFIDSKKSLLQELTQKLQILEVQKQSYSQQLKNYSRQLETIKQLHRQEVSLAKKHSRRRKDPSSRSQKKGKEQQNEKIEEFNKQIEERPSYRWRGNKLRRLCFLVFTLLLVLGLLLSSVSILLP